MTPVDLPKLFFSSGQAVFKSTPDLVHNWSHGAGITTLTIPSSSPSGFEIRCEAEKEQITLHWGNWHTPFELEASADQLVQDLFGLVRDMLSTDMRLRELVAGSTPYRGFLESFDGAAWTIEQEMGLAFWNFFAKRTERIFTNTALPPRMSVEQPR